MDEIFSEFDLFVSPDGSDAATGRAPSADGAHGPFATIERARDEIRKRKGVLDGQHSTFHAGAVNTPCTVWVRGGTYSITRPIVFDHRDSAPVTYRAYPSEYPTISSSVTLADWTDGTINGRACWVAPQPRIRGEAVGFRSLFVNGERRPRARFPKQGSLQLAHVDGLPVRGDWQIRGGWRSFFLQPNDIPEIGDPSRTEAVITHFWIEERSTLDSVNPESGEVVLARPTQAPLHASYGEGLAVCFFENVRSCVTEPGEWFLDEEKHLVYYIPKEGETPGTVSVCIPATLQLLVVRGDSERGRFVDNLQFVGLTFFCTDWRHPDASDGPRSGYGPPGFEAGVQFWDGSNGRKDLAGAPQAAADVPGVVSLRGCRDVTVEGCTFHGLGWYALQIAHGSARVTVQHCEIRDTGAGGVTVNGSSAAEPIHGRTGYHSIVDNHIHAGGRVFFSAVGVLVMHAAHNEISHNHIHDYYYSGVSIGWVWGYGESVACHNQVEFNHIHNLGQGVLSDMGGIYTLGVQPGTVIRYNHIHDITKVHYGAWCIYLDAGSSYILVEGNVCHSTDDTAFNVNFGRENLIRCNVFGLSESAVLAHGMANREHIAFRVERNVLISRGEAFFRSNYDDGFVEPNHESDLNILVPLGNGGVVFRNRSGSIVAGIDRWRALGHDRHSKLHEGVASADGETNLQTIVGVLGSVDQADLLADIGFVQPRLEEVGVRGVSGVERMHTEEARQQRAVGEDAE